MSDKKFTSVLQKYREAISIIVSVLATLIFFIILYYAFTIGHDNEKAINAADIVFSWQASLITLGSFLLLLAILSFFISWAELYNLLKLIIKKNWNKLHFWIKLSALLLSLFFIVCSIYSSPIEARFAIIQRLSSPDELLNARNIFIGLFGTFSLFAVMWRSYVADKQSKIDDRKTRLEENRRLDERFTKAVGLLSGEINSRSYSAHVVAITELRHIAVDDEQYTQKCIDVICECNQWMENYLDEFIKQCPPHYYGVTNLFSNRRLTEKHRIAHDAEASENSPASLLEERRSQEALKAISYILKKLGEDKTEKHRIKELKFANKMLCGIDLSYAQINHINFSHAYLVTSDLRNAQMNNSNLILADLTGAYLSNSAMDKSNLTHAILWYTDLSGVHLRTSVLDDAKMQEANLRMANLENSSIQYANLTIADLSCAYLSGSNLTGSIIACANLYKAQLKLADLQSTHLILSDLTAADLSGAIIVRANLKGVVLQKTKLNYSCMIGCDLNNVIIDNPSYKKILFDTFHPHLHILVEDRIKEWLQKKSFRHDRDEFLSLLESQERVIPKEIENFAKESLLEKRDHKWYFKQGAEKIIREHHRRLISELENRAAFNLTNQQETYKGSLPDIKGGLEKLYKKYTNNNSPA